MRFTGIRSAHRPAWDKVSGRVFAYAFGFLLPVVHVTVAFAQGQQGGSGQGGSGSGQGGSGQGGSGQGGSGQGGSTTINVTPGQTQLFPGGVAPPPPGSNLGGGNAQYSSSKPIQGPNDRDSFDFKRGGSGGSVYGGQGGSFNLGDRGPRGGGVPPNTHLVRRGDTLWHICDFYFRNPYQWPRIWSYNPQIQNPHWIYPGDQVRLRNGFDPSPEPGSPITDRRRQVPPDTIFLRNQGYIEDETNNWGEITGSREDKMILSDNDEVYIRVSSNKEVKIGQELTVFRPTRAIGSGKLIEIEGTVKVDQWNPKERIARARITESLDAIERGARIGPVTRRFEVVPPARNEKDVEASVLTSVHPHNFYGANQVVFIDKGEDDGLKPGNRLHVIRKGDAFHQSQPTGGSAQRIALEDEAPAATEPIVKPRDEGVLPEEVVAELRVISVKKSTAMTLVTLSRREIEIGERAFARKGY